jgi:hypothetical protein
LECIDGLLHLNGIPGAVKGMIGEKLTNGEEIEVEVLEIDIEQQRISLRIPMNDMDGNDQRVCFRAGVNPYVDGPLLARCFAVL